MKFIKFFAGSFLLFFILFFNHHCASVATSLGGPKDSLAPILIKNFPKDSQLNFKGKKIQFYFNEFIQGKDLNQRFFMSPNVKNPPLLSTKLNRFIVEIQDSLLDSTTYSFVVDRGIADLNEGNVFRKLSFCFSTYNKLDLARYRGCVMNAETGGFDSNVIVVLYKNISNDSVVFKEQPDYYAPVDNKGNFYFNFLPKDTFLAFVLPNGFNKTYFDSTKPFAFLNHTIISSLDTNLNDSFYFYSSYKKTPPFKGAKLIKNLKPKDLPKILYQLSFENNQFDILKDFDITFNNKVFYNDSVNIVLLDTFFKPIKDVHFYFDTVYNKFNVKYSWLPNKSYLMIFPQRIVFDEYGQYYAKNDTIKFSTFNENKYTNMLLRLKNIDLTMPYLLQVIFNNKQILFTLPITKNAIKIPYTYDGNYSFRVVLDKNQNGKWDKGFYSRALKIQPEKVFPLNGVYKVKPNWDNEFILKFE